MNINIKSDILKMKVLEKENAELKELLENENSKLNQLKEQITNEFQLLEIKSNDYSTKLSELELKELEIMKKSNELNQQISKYEYLFKSKYLQLEISDPNNKNSYRWLIKNPINNIISIKLMSYSLPVPRFNINKHNNSLSFKINDNIINININPGKYTIEELILIINNKLIDIKLSINPQQYIIIDSDKNFEIINTIMIKEVFGFTSICNNNQQYISDNIWDLRIDDKILLFLNNLSDNPFGVLYFNGHSDSHFKFEKPFNLDSLDITFKDLKGREYDFNNLQHSLSFLIEQIN